MSRFATGQPRAASSGRRKGTPNKNTVRAKQLVAEGKDAKIVERVMLGAENGEAEALRIYFRYLRPQPPRTLGTVAIAAPRNAQEARDSIAEIVGMLAAGEIDVEHGRALISALEAFLNARAAELEALYERDRAREGGA